MLVKGIIVPIKFIGAELTKSAMSIEFVQLTIYKPLYKHFHDLLIDEMSTLDIILEILPGGIHPQLVPYDLLTDKEKKKDRERSQEFLKYLQYQGYKLHRPSKATQSDTEQTTTGVAIELRFAYSLLEKLIQYIDRATINMKILKPSTTFSRRSSFKTSTRDIKFFSKVSLVSVYLYSNDPVTKTFSTKFNNL